MRLVRTAVWLALWGAAGCSTGPDLSSLQFLPEDLQTTDGKTDHVAPPDTTPRDEQEEVALPPAKKCWEAFYCVLTGVFAGTCSPEDLNCYRECAESETWDTDLPELWAVEECFRGCMEGKESDAAWECVGDYCNKDILYCMIPKGGTQSCAEGMVCNSDCVSMYGDGTAAAMNCSAACFEKSSYSEIPKIQALFKDCATPESTQTPDASAEQACTEAVIGCFQGSGDKSCGAIVDCVVDCCADVPDKCEGEDKCSTACMLGASSDFGKGFKGVMPCWDDEAAVQVNPFPCLAGMAECYKVTKEDEGKQCISIMADLKTAYDSTTLSVEARISTMTNVVKGANAQEAVDLVEALGCLAGKEGKDTTFGNVGLAGWTTCTAKCKSQPVPL